MGIDLSKLTGKFLEIAKNADNKAGMTNGVWLDNNTEISLFMSDVKDAVKNGEVSIEDVGELLGFTQSAKAQKTRAGSSDYDEKVVDAYINKLSRAQREDVTYKTRKTTDEEVTLLAHNLDMMLLENGITGVESRPAFVYQFKFPELIKQYEERQKIFNEADSKIDNWYKSPDSKKVEGKLKNELEDAAQSVLGMSYQEFTAELAKYPDEVKAIETLPIGKDTTSKYERAIKVANMSEKGQELYHKIEQMNSVLYRNFKSWEHDMILKSNDKTYEMNSEIMDSMFTVEMNEFAKSKKDFEMPSNWLVKKHFINSTCEAAGIENGIQSPQAESKPTTRKIKKDGEYIIEKTYPNGEKKYYNISGIEIKY